LSLSNYLNIHVKWYVRRKPNLSTYGSFLIETTCKSLSSCTLDPVTILIHFSSGWLPPADCWNSSDRLPYGWEIAADVHGKNYFVNHLNKTTTVEDPRKWEIMEQVNELLTSELKMVIQFRKYSRSRIMWSLWARPRTDEICLLMFNKWDLEIWSH